MSQAPGTIPTGQSLGQGVTRDEVRDLFREFTQNRNMTPEQGGAQLMADNALLREDKRRLKDALEAAKSQIPPDGSLVLKGDDVKLHNDLVALLKDGVKVEALPKMLKEHGELSTENEVLKKQALAITIAEAEGWKVSALLRLTAGMDLLTEEVEEEIDDPDKEGEKKKVKVVRGFLNVKDASGTVTNKRRLSEELKDFIPSLVKAEESGGGSEQESSAANEAGTKFVRQSSGSKASPESKRASAKVLGRYRRPEPAK